jgi:2-polyprenyl-6-methoxyphenol hydroxylase-like FAD-dependent oxidoreductase
MRCALLLPGLVVVAPLPGQRYRGVATLDEAPKHPDTGDVQALLDARAPAKVTDVVWNSRFRVHDRVTDAFRRGRVLVAGDAAHVHSRAGGRGMNTAIREALTLHPLLADVLVRPRRPRRLLRSQPCPRAAPKEFAR